MCQTISTCVKTAFDTHLNFYLGHIVKIEYVHTFLSEHLQWSELAFHNKDIWILLNCRGIIDIQLHGDQLNMTVAR